MKTIIGIILGVVLGAAIITGVSLWLIFSVLPAGNQEPHTGIATLTPSSAATVPLPSTSTLPVISPTPPPATTQSPAQSNVNFSLNISNFNVSGLTSGTVNAQITNTGTADARNVWVKVQIISQGSIVKIGGQDYFRKDIGTMTPGETVNSQVTLSVSLADGLKIAQSGATFELTVYSDEKTQTLTYDYKP